MKKKVTSILLVLILLLGCGSTGFAAYSPSDVSGLDCEKAVKALSEAGVISGYADGSCRPAGIVTRAEAAKLLATALGRGNATPVGNDHFPDIRGHWAARYINEAYNLGLIKGYTDGTFRPDAILTYYELLTMLVSGLGYAKPPGNWPANYIEVARAIGIIGSVEITGKGASRGDTAILLYQTWDKPIGTLVNGIWDPGQVKDTMQIRLQAGAPATEPTQPGAGNSGGGSQAKAGLSLDDIVSKMKRSIDGEKAYDYMSYLYMGWRTTGGPWQNHVIRDFLVGELKKGQYTFAESDKSASADKDYVWIQQDTSNALVWAPQFASLQITSSGDKALIDTFNVTSYAFDPTSTAYMTHYEETLGVTNIDEMYQWITRKGADGKRINVANGLEAELNKRAHLATNSCFTDAANTPVANAKGVEGEVVYIGLAQKQEVDGNTVFYGEKTGIDGNAGLAGKVLLSDSRNAITFDLAKQVGAVAIMTTAALSDYNNPVINGEQWYTDSARFARGASAVKSLERMNAAAPIVQWNLSLNQKTALMELLAEGNPVKIKSVAIGSISSMALDQGGEGQLTAIAEIAGTTKAEERVMFMAHVQEPGACDNASGVGVQLELALKLKQMIDSGKLKRPARTITFFWGDEMACSRLWLDAHPAEQLKVVCTIDLDMVGEDPTKTGGPMRIEKTPDPSAVYNYTLDVLPGQEPYSDPEAFVRLPDSHTLWGAGDTPDIKGLYLNDLYMAATQNVIRAVDPGFKVAVCPYEGGSDHTVFLEAGIPSVLTWHFTDYIYHTTKDTLDMASAREMRSVGLTSLAAGYMAAVAGEFEATEMMRMVYSAAEERFARESQNTQKHVAWVQANGKNLDEALALELEVLRAWGKWYAEALGSCGTYFVGDQPGDIYKARESKYLTQINQLMTDALNRANQLFAEAKAAA